MAPREAALPAAHPAVPRVEVALAQAAPQAVQVAAPVALQAVVAVADCQAVVVLHQVSACPEAEAKAVNLEVMAAHLADKQRVMAEAQAQAHRVATQALAMLQVVTYRYPAWWTKYLPLAVSQQAMVKRAAAQAVRVDPPAVRHQAHSQVRNLLKAAVARVVRTVAAAQAVHRQAGR